MADKVFWEGIIVKTIETQYWELKKLSFKTSEFKDFLDKYDNNWWVNLTMKKSQSTWKDYVELDTWKPKTEWSQDIWIEDIPF